MYPRVLSLPVFLFALCGLLAAVPCAAQAPSLCEAVDDCAHVWTTSGVADWFGQTLTTADEVDAAQSGDITDGESSIMEMTIEGPANIAFLWKVSSEENYDYLAFSIDGTLQEEISGFVDWTVKTYTLAEGSHTLTWEYYKDTSESYGLDAGVVDSFTVYALGTGSVRTVITPEAAVTEGAQWSLDGGVWQDSGVTLSGVSAGPHTVAFKSAGIWLAPASLHVIVSGGTTKEVTGKYFSLCEGVGACNRDWTVSGDAGWFTQTAVNHDGHNACQNRGIADDGSASMSTTVTGPVSVSFWWKVSSELDYDYLTFYVDEVNISSISGEVDWAQVTHDLSDGPHTLTWTYSKDGSNFDGADAGWVDQFVVLESDPPTGSVVVNGGAARTATPEVLLDLTYADEGAGVTGMRFSNNGSTWSAWQKPAAQKAWTLAAGDGTKTVRAQFRDKAGNVSAVYTDTIVLDQTAPTGSIVIGSGAFVTDILEVMINMTWDDGAGSGVSRMRFSDNGSTWSAWEPVAAGKVWTLPGWGYRTVRVQFRDRAGNVSAAYSDYIKAVAP